MGWGLVHMLGIVLEGLACWNFRSPFAWNRCLRWEQLSRRSEGVVFCHSEGTICGLDTLYVCTTGFSRCRRRSGSTVERVSKARNLKQPDTTKKKK